MQILLLNPWTENGHSRDLSPPAELDSSKATCDSDEAVASETVTPSLNIFSGVVEG